jgi:hypothetical protein
VLLSKDHAVPAPSAAGFSSRITRVAVEAGFRIRAHALRCACAQILINIAEAVKSY